ncbi:40S ribosomal protein S23 [Cavenderia fasciculata]|uniref:40S ribosomal protein S23 n=1 Tax=Cavenderia fasciculata TaxID=261658 RepID=F4Q682_CACFS|nr:40S ribosomal protein S23 [Cavenderia fasciculata]EGG17456.1 40S ribosomal protein S23 [Cavenderia fasciculata]|eukprot:XP_004355940.1 40S ribosomal protein S23 [Cavenderia fasciculata]
MNDPMVKKYNAGTNRASSGINQKKIEEDEGDLKLPQLKASVPQAIQRARVALKLTQKELAVKINERQSVVNEYESGSAIPSIAILIKLEKTLNVKLRGKDIGHPLKMPNGIQTARKLRLHRQANRWHDKQYKKAHFGTALKANPFGGASHASGIVVTRLGIEAKQPNSAIRKCVRVQLKKNGKKITAFVPGDGCLNYIQENDKVLVAGFGRSGHAVGDIPGVRFKVVKVSSVSLLAIYKGKKEKPNV